MTRKNRLLAVILAVMFLCFVTSIPAFANEELPSVDSYAEDLMDALPDEVRDNLPWDGEEDLINVVDEGYLASLSLVIFRDALFRLMRFSCFMLGVLLTVALAERLDSALGGEIATTVSNLSVLMVALELYGLFCTLFETVSLYLTRLEEYLTVLTAVMGSVTVLGGGALQSATLSPTLTSVLALLGGIVGRLLFPILEVSFAANITSVVSKRVNLSGLADLLRGVFLFAIGFLAMIAVVVLTFQTVLAGAEDSLSARSLRYAASSAIPIVGGAVGDSVRVLAASVSVVKKTVGSVGMIALLIMSFYPMAELFAASLALSLSKAVAGILGVTTVEPILQNSQKCIQMMMAVVSLLSVFFVFSIGIYAFSAVPLEGSV